MDWKQLFGRGKRRVGSGVFRHSHEYDNDEEA